MANITKYGFTVDPHTFIGVFEFKYRFNDEVFTHKVTVNGPAHFAALLALFSTEPLDLKRTPHGPIIESGWESVDN